MLLKVSLVVLSRPRREGLKIMVLGFTPNALKKLKENPDVALVLLDWNMPNMNGLDCLKSIKADASTKAIPVMMVTSEAEKTKIIEAVQAGASNYLVKPFDADSLKAKITALMGG